MWVKQNLKNMAYLCNCENKISQFLYFLLNRKWKSLLIYLTASTSLTQIQMEEKAKVLMRKTAINDV